MTFREFLQIYRQRNGLPLSSASIEKYGVQGPIWLEKRIPIENLIELAATGKKSLPVQQLYDTFYESHKKIRGQVHVARIVQIPLSIRKIAVGFASGPIHDLRASLGLG